MVYILKLWAIKEVVDLIIWDDENATLLYEIPLYFLIVFIFVPMQSSRWMLKGITSDTITKTNERVYTLYSFPTNVTGLLAIIPGLGVSGMRTLIRHDNQFYICGFHRMIYKVVPISFSKVNSISKCCIVRHEPEVNNPSAFLDMLKTIKAKWIPFRSTCVQVSRVKYEAFGIKFYSSFPSRHLQILESRKKKINDG